MFLVVVNFSGKNSKTRQLRSRWFELHRPSSKGTKLLFQVMEAIIKHEISTETKSYRDLTSSDLFSPPNPHIFMYVRVFVYVFVNMATCLYLSLHALYREKNTRNFT